MLLPSLLLSFQSLLAPTVPAELLTIRAACWGDSQAGTPIFRQVVGAMQAERPDFLLSVGDLQQNRCALPDEWATQFLGPMAPLLHLPRFAVAGNHDCPVLFQQFVTALPSHLPGGLGLWNAVTIGSVRLLLMDSNQESFELRTSMMAGGPQRAWLEAELASQAWAAATWRICMWHAPAVTERWTGSPCYYPRNGVEHAPWAWAMDRLAAAGCHLVLNGHSHSWQRGTWRGMAWAVTGGGGGGLDTSVCADEPEVDAARSVHHFCTLDIYPTGLVLRALDLQRREFDRVAIARRP